MQVRRSSVRLLAALWLTAACLAGIGVTVAAPPRGLRFDSPEVLDLSSRLDSSDQGSTVPVLPLAGEEGERIRAAPVVDEEHGSLPFSDDLFGCKAPAANCARAGERRLIDASGGAVQRSGQRLTITTAAGKTVEFVDWNKPASRSADGDSEAHRYLGRLPGSGYLRVEVQFGHDAPGSFLLNPATGKTAFVHNGGDVVALAPDGGSIVVFNTLNPPLVLQLGVLDDTGPHLGLRCTAGADAGSWQFKGWHAAHAFDLALQPKGAKPDETLVLRVARKADAWQVMTPDPDRLVRGAGFSCRQR